MKGRWLLFVVFIGSLLLKGCAGAEPLFHPIPYTGNLAINTSIVFDDDIAIEFCETAGHLAGCLWNLFDTEGNLTGTYQTHNETISDLMEDGDGKISFNFETTHCTDCGADVDLNGEICGDADDVCFHSLNQLVSFPIFEENPPIEPEDCEGFMPGSTIYPLSGWALGTVMDDPRTTGEFRDKIGCNVHYRSVFEAHRYSDGFVAFCRTNGCSWFVECPEEVE